MSKQSKAANGAKLKKYPPEMALAFLESAVAYCQGAGLSVTVANLPGVDNAQSGALVLTVTGAQSRLDADGVTRFEVRSATVPGHTLPAYCPACFGNPHRDDPGRTCPECGRHTPEVSHA